MEIYCKEELSYAHPKDNHSYHVDMRRSRSLFRNETQFIITMENIKLFYLNDHLASWFLPRSTNSCLFVARLERKLKVADNKRLHLQLPVLLFSYTLSLFSQGVWSYCSRSPSKLTKTPGSYALYCTSFLSVKKVKKSISEGTIKLSQSLGISLGYGLYFPTLGRYFLHEPHFKGTQTFYLHFQTINSSLADLQIAITSLTRVSNYDFNR